jgi:type IV pilus assembly protein PilA
LPPPTPAVPFTTISEIINMPNLKRRIAEARKADEGFTLIELAVVILIIGILLLLAIPSFLGVKKKAQDKAAQSALKVLLTDAKALYGDVNNFSGADSVGLATTEPGYTVRDGSTASTGPKIISVAVTAGNSMWSAAAKSQSSRCFYIRDSDASGTTFGSGTGTCDGATAATTATNTTWA